MCVFGVGSGVERGGWEVMSEEEEEQEIDALERLRGELGEKFEADMNNLQIIQVITV